MLSKFGDICPMVIKANTEHISPAFEERRMKTYGGAWGFIFLPHLTQFLTSVGILLRTHRGISHSSFLDTTAMAFKQSLQPSYRNPRPANRGCVLPWLERLHQPQGALLAALGAWRETQSHTAALAQGFAPFCTSGSFSPSRENGFWKYIAAKQVTEIPSSPIGFGPLQDSLLCPTKEANTLWASQTASTDRLHSGWCLQPWPSYQSCCWKLSLQTADFFRKDWGKNTAQKQRRVLQGTTKHQIMARAANSRTNL